MKRFLLILTLLIVFLQYSCEPEVQVPNEPEPAEEAVIPPKLGVPYVDYRLHNKSIKFTDWNKAFAGINLDNGDVYVGDGVHSHQHEVDILLFDFKNSTKMNLATPSSNELSVNVLGEDIQYGWRRKNKSTIVRVSNITESMVSWFNNLNAAAAIQVAVDSVMAIQTNQKLDRYRNLSKNELIFIKSIDRNITSVILVENAERNTESGGHSSINLTIKTNAKNLTSKEEVTQGLLNSNNYYADTLVGYFDRNNPSEIYFNFQNKQVYARAQLTTENKVSQTNWIFARSFVGNSSYVMDGEYRLIMPNSNKAIGEYDKSLATLFANNSPQSMEFRKVSVNDINHIEAYSKYLSKPFDKVRLNNASLKEYVEMFIKPKELGESVASYTLTSSWKNVVWVVRNKSNGSYGIVKFLDIDYDQKVTDKPGVFKIAVKYFNTLD